MHELTALTRKMKSMSRESLRAAVLAGAFPLPSDITMERTVLKLERRALIDEMEGTTPPFKKTTKKWTTKQVTDLTNWFATLESRWVERLEQGTVAQLVVVQRSKRQTGDERVDSLVEMFTRLHPRGVYQPLDAKVTRDTSAILELAANKSLLTALASAGVRVRGYVALSLSGNNRRAVRPVMCSCAGGMVRHDAPQRKADERAAAVVAAAVESLIAPQPRKRMAAPIKTIVVKRVVKPAVKPVVKPVVKRVVVDKKAKPPAAKRQRVLDSQ